MSDEEICKMMGWSRRAAEVLADNPDGLLSRICAVVREAERREREACAGVCDFEVARLTAIDEPRPALAVGICAATIRARNNK